MVLSPHVHVKEHTLFGFKCKGIFALNDINAGDEVWKWDKETEAIEYFSAEEIKQHEHSEKLKMFSYMLGDDTFGSTIDAEIDISYYFNHSCEPNIGYNGDERLVAMRNIAKGEHLVYDYAFTETESSQHSGLRCQCKSKNCRGILTFGQWRSRNYMNKYRQYVTDYIFSKHCETGWFDPRIERRFKDKDKQVSGLFCRAGHRFKAGERALVFGGKVVHYKDVFGEEQAGYTARDYQMSLQIHDDMWQVQSWKENGSFSETGDYINHSCDANCGMGDSITVVVMRDIEPNEEITIDYAMVNSGIMSEPSDNFICECGSVICRGKVSSHDWKLPEVQQKNRNFFSPFVQRLIDQQNRNIHQLAGP